MTKMSFYLNAHSLFLSTLMANLSFGLNTPSWFLSNFMSELLALKFSTLMTQPKLSFYLLFLKQ